MKDANDDKITFDGKTLPIVESFYSIQGEGFNTGKPAYFIRIGGCDVGCRWCDSKESWNYSRFPQIAIENIVADALKYPARAIVLTGGEPLNFPLDPLCNLLKKNGFTIFLETSGSSQFSGRFDWICLSPKKGKPPVDQQIYQMADELKIIVENDSDFIWGEECRKLVKNNCLLLFQPEWSKIKIVVPQIVEYVKEHPDWNISLQAHKFMNIP